MQGLVLDNFIAVIGLYSHNGKSYLFFPNFQQKIPNFRSPFISSTFLKKKSRANVIVMSAASASARVSALVEFFVGVHS